MQNRPFRLASVLSLGLVLAFAALTIALLGDDQADAQVAVDRSKLTPRAFVPQLAADSATGGLPTATPTKTPPVGSTATPTQSGPTATRTNTPPPGSTNTPTFTPTQSGPTATNSPTMTNTPVPGSTNTPTPTRTNTPTATNTPVPGSTNTPTPTSTPVPPTATNTPVTPTATPTQQSQGPNIISISPNEVIDGTLTRFVITGAGFASGSSIQWRYLNEGAGNPQTVDPSKVEYYNSGFMAFTYRFTFFSYPYEVPESLVEVKVVGPNGASNGFTIAIQQKVFECTGPGQVTSSSFAIIQWSHGRPCNGDNVTLTVTLASGTSASAMYFRFANGTCQPTKNYFTQQGVDAQGREVWVASATYTLQPTEHFGYRIVAARTGSGDLFWNEPTTAGAAPFGSECEFPPQAP